MIFSRRCPSATRPFDQTPSPSGPRSSMVAAMRSTAATSARPPSTRNSRQTRTYRAVLPRTRPRYARFHASDPHTLRDRVLTASRQRYVRGVFDWSIVPAVVIVGLAVASLYGMLPIAIVLTFRISRTVGFVHGGIAIFGGLFYTLLANGPIHDRGFQRNPVMDLRLALVCAIAGGAVLGAGYGALVMSRWMAAMPGLTLTVVSIAGLFLIGNLSAYYIHPGGASVAASPFGEGGTKFDQIGTPVVLTDHRLAVLLILCTLVVTLTIFLNTTYTGLAIRAFADDVEAGVWCGANLRVIGTGVYAASGAISAMAGAFFAAAVADPVDGMLVLFVKGMLLSVVGGMRSVSLALLAAVVYAVLESALIVGFFGEVGRGTQEVVLSLTLLALIVAAARVRKDSFFQLQGHTT